MLDLSIFDHEITVFCAHTNFNWDILDDHTEAKIAIMTKIPSIKYLLNNQ